MWAVRLKRWYSHLLVDVLTTPECSQNALNVPDTPWVGFASPWVASSGQQKFNLSLYGSFYKICRFDNKTEFIKITLFRDLLLFLEYHSPHKSRIKKTRTKLGYCEEMEVKFDNLLKYEKKILHLIYNEYFNKQMLWLISSNFWQ